MNPTDQPITKKRVSLSFLSMLIGGNALLFLFVAGLCMLAVEGSRPSLSLENNDARQAVESYLASRVPAERYRIRQWYPAERLASSKEDAYSQRVTMVFYGPNGPKELDTVYWVKNGKVSYTTNPQPKRNAQS